MEHGRYNLHPVRTCYRYAYLHVFVIILILMHHSLCGYSPFQAESHNELIRQAEQADYEFHERYWKGVSEDGQ